MDDEFELYDVRPKPTRAESWGVTLGELIAYSMLATLALAYVVLVLGLVVAFERLVVLL